MSVRLASGKKVKHNPHTKFKFAPGTSYPRYATDGLRN